MSGDCISDSSEEVYWIYMTKKQLCGLHNRQRKVYSKFRAKYSIVGTTFALIQGSIAIVLRSFSVAGKAGFY